MASTTVTPTSTTHYGWLAHLRIRYKISLAIGLLLALFLINTSINMFSQGRQTQTRLWADHTYQVLLQIEYAQDEALAGQVGLRGYVLNRKPTELQRVYDTGHALGAILQTIRQLTADNPLQQGRLDHIQELYQRWTSEMQSMLLAPLTAAAQQYEGVEATTAMSKVTANYLAKRSVTVEDYTGVLAQMRDTENALLTRRNAAAESLRKQTDIINAASGVIGLALALWVISLTSRLVVRPIRRLTDSMTLLARHDHSIHISGTARRDEVGEIARALQVFKQMVIDSREQADLKAVAATISNSLQEATNHREFAERLTSQLTPELGAGVSLFYGFDEARQRLDMLGSYGMRFSNSPDAYVPGEGLIGQCALSRKPMVLNDVPENYLQIGTGSGSALPRYVCLRPLLLREQLVGVFEFAGFGLPDTAHLQLLDELLPMAALTLENLNRAINTQDLLEQTREQADELRLTAVTMRQQQEALRNANESLQTKTTELEEQSQRLQASEEELRVQADELQASNEELRLKTDTLRQQKQQVEALQKETEEKAEEIERASRYKSEFLANMSHELRTPLNSLLILSRSLAENRAGHLDEEEVESSRIIHDAGSSLLRLINDILDLSKIEAGKMELSLSDLPLSNLARGLKRTFDHVAKEKKLDFQVNLEPHLPEHIQTDPVRLEQIVNNLLANAFKFTTHGSVKVRIGHPTVDIPVPARLKDTPLVAISVQDSGIGIAPEKLERIFNAFEQADSSTSRQFGGTGLGLSISRRLAAMLGGDIVLSSQVGQGSEFTLLLPEQSEPVPVEENADGADNAPTPTPRPVTRTMLPAQAIPDDRERIAPGDSVILIIEDDVAFARILGDIVRQKGHRMLHSPDGEEGLALARRFHPVGILLDVMLPGMDGWSVIERLKSEAATRHIPVHFLSATDEASRGKELGAVGFLTKPVTREAINDAFERLMHFAKGRTRHLLVVDDDANSRSAVRHLLNQQGDVLIDEAGSGEEALQKIENTGYDCIVLDLGLPGISGLELLEKLNQSGSVPPVVVYSGRELSREENLRIRQYTDSIVIKGARSPERLLDEVSLFLHSIQHANGNGGASSGGNAGSSHAHTLAPTPSYDGLSGHQILLVDDDMRNLFALSKVLRGWGLNVTMAQDGPKALSTLAENKAIELVLMDIMMPGMDGYETTRAIRAQPELAKLPVIALTAKAMRGDREQCLEAGANDYLSKPIDLDKLASMMHVWLRG